MEYVRVGKNESVDSNLTSQISSRSTSVNSSCNIQGDTSGCDEPPVDIKTKVPVWPGQDRPGQNGTFVLKSTGGSSQPDVSPCTVFYY